MELSFESGFGCGFIRAAGAFERGSIRGVQKRNIRIFLDQEWESFDCLGGLPLCGFESQAADRLQQGILRGIDFGREECDMERSEPKGENNLVRRRRAGELSG